MTLSSFESTKIMIETFLQQLSNKNLISFSDKVLLAVSGGVDSMVMLHMFLSQKMNIGVAHINHGLRGDESDLDEKLVSDFCKSSSIPYFNHTIEGGALANGNLQNEARQIRYDFLQQVAAGNDYDWIATAHHKDDSVENMLMNMMRGTGLEGLVGIKAKNKNIIRPLLPFNSQQIRQYAQDNAVPFREDSSNMSNKYKRNKVRNEILPILYNADERSEVGLKMTLENLYHTQQLYEEMLNNLRKDIVFKNNKTIIIDLEYIKKYDNSNLLLFEILSQYGFNYAQCSTIIKNDTSIGSEFISDNYRAFLDRQSLWLSSLNNITYLDNIKINLDNCPLYINIGEKHYEFELVDYSNSLIFEKDTLYLEADMLPKELTIRYRKEGDRFHPLGMKGQSQKLKDYFINKKIPQALKECIPLLTCPEAICAVLMYGISEKYSIKKTSLKVLKITEIQLISVGQ